MIRVNLLRNMSGGAGQMSGGTGVTTAMGSGALSPDAQKRLAMRLAVVLGAVGLVWFYEQSEISVKQNELANIRQQISTIQAKKQQYGDAGPIVEKYTQQKAVLESQIKVLESVTVNRLREVKLLDAIQSILPQKAWLESIKVEKGRATISGLAPDAETVNNLYRQLENNVLFSDVQQRQNVDKDIPELGLLRAFEFQFVAGRPEKQL